MRKRIYPSHAWGEVTAPPSKSMAHRLLICSGLAKGESLIRNVAPSQDILATTDCLRALGARVRSEENGVRVVGCDPKDAAGGVLPCRESGSTLRFFLPLCLLGGERMLLTGAPRLLERPQTVYRTLCEERGIAWEQTSSGIAVQGRLTSGTYYLDGGVSSQFISGLLFALPLLHGDSCIRILSEPESRPYIELTRGALADAGVRTEWRDSRTLYVPGDQCYHAICGEVEGDYSNAAFFDALNLLGGDVTVRGLREGSMQGDAVYRRLFDRLARGDKEPIDLRNCPDLAPICFAVAAALHGACFIGTERLKWKECDRTAAMQRELAAFGGRLHDLEDRVVVEGGALHAPDRVLCGHNDHRIVMALSVLLTRFGGEIAGAEAVAKSMPNFFEALDGLHVAAVTVESGEETTC